MIDHISYLQMISNRECINSCAIYLKPSVHQNELKQQQNNLLIDEKLNNMDFPRFIYDEERIKKKVKYFFKESIGERMAKAEVRSENMAEEKNVNEKNQNKQIDIILDENLNIENE